MELINEAKRMQQLAGLINEDISTLPETQKTFTVIDSYSSRNDRDDYNYDYIDSTDLRSALVKYLVDKQEGTPEEIEEFISDIETRFDHKKGRRGAYEMWTTDDPFYIVVTGKLDTDQMDKLVKRF